MPSGIDGAVTDQSAETLLKRAEELDAFDAILPFDRRDQLASLLTDDDVATLKHLANEGMGENTLRALASDLGYLDAWCLLATGSPLPWPAPEALLSKFVAHHLWDPVKRTEDPSHGMPADVDEGLRLQGLLKAVGPHAPGTVRRRLTSWSILTRWRGLIGFFSEPALKSALRLAVRDRPTSSAQEQGCRHRRHPGKADRHLFRKQAGRYPRSCHPAHRLRFWRPAAIGDRQSADRRPRR